MNPAIIHDILLGILVLLAIANQWRMECLLAPARRLLNQDERRRAAHTAAFERLTDTEAIQADMERSAIASEALRANRTTEPREGAGPHAVVHRVRKMRSKPPHGWNPPADYSARLRAHTEAKLAEGNEPK